MEIRGNEGSESQDDSIALKNANEVCLNDHEVQTGCAQEMNQYSASAIPCTCNETTSSCSRCSEKNKALSVRLCDTNFLDQDPHLRLCNSSCLSTESQSPTSVNSDPSGTSEARGSCSGFPSLRSNCGIEGTANNTDNQVAGTKLNNELENVSSKFISQGECSSRMDKNSIFQSVLATEKIEDPVELSSRDITVNIENLTVSSENTVFHNLSESDSENALAISSDELSDSDRTADSNFNENDADISTSSTSTEITSPEEEEKSSSSLRTTRNKSGYSPVKDPGAKVLRSKAISPVSIGISSTNDMRESDMDCEIDGERVKFMRNASLSKQDWDAEMWNSPPSSPKLTAKDIFAKIDKDFKAHAMELKSRNLFLRSHADLHLRTLNKLNLSRSPELSSSDRNPGVSCQNPSKLTPNHPSFSEARSRSAESRAHDNLRKIISDPLDKCNSTPSLDQLPSYTNEEEARDMGEVCVIVPKRTNQPPRLSRSHNALGGVSAIFNSDASPRCDRVNPVPTEPTGTRSEIWHCAKKMKGLSCDVLEGDKSDLCLSNVGREIVSSSGAMVRCGTTGGNPNQSHVEALGHPEYRRHTFPDIKEFSVPAKVAVVFPLRDAPCSDNNGDESKTTTGVLVGADGRPTSPGGDLRPPSVCSAHSTSKPVSPAKSKALSSKHSSKHSSPIKTLSTTTVNTVPDIEHSDSLDSDDQSSRVSTGLGSLEVVVCPVQKTHHVGREIVNTVYGIPIDSLFTLLFTNSKMMLEVHAIRKTTDVVASPWQSKDDGQQRLRQVTYTVTLPTSSFGPKVSHVTEIQVMSELTVPGEYYSVDAEATNAGIPYAESFLVSNHWCLTRESSTETRLAVYTSVKYKKSMWGFMKSVIDKNSYSGVEELLQGIDSALQQEVTEHANMRQRTRRRRRRGTVKLEGDSAVALPVGALPVATVPGAAVAGAVGVVKDKTKAKLPVNNLLVNRLLGPSSIRSATLPRVAPLGSGSAALSAAAWQSPTPDEEEQPWGWPRCRSVFTTLLLILLLLTNFLLFWRLTKLEDMVKVQPHYAALRGFMHLDPDIIRKEVTSDTMLQILQEQELSHVKMTEDWRNRISEAESLLHKAEGMLRGLHASIPAEQSAASRTLLDRIRSSSSVLQASLEGSNLKRSEHEPSLAFSFGADIESDSSHSRREL